MEKPTYTAIPDTSDENYWEVSENPLTRSRSFKPKNKELHRQLKSEAWKLIQASQSRSRRKG